MKIVLSFAFMFILNTTTSWSQVVIDSTTSKKTSCFNYKSFILPAVMVGYGIIGLKNHEIQNINSDTRTEIKEHIDQKLSIDDISQYSPALAVYGLNALGIQGKHLFKDRTIVLGTAYLLMAVTVNSFKYTTKVERPDGSSNNSFPSGHTATAFLGAEFLYQEYKEVSPWIGIMGYTIATGTGYFRMYNNRHWFSDVIAGAGIGIGSTKIAYLIYPYLSKLFNTKKMSKNTGLILPFYTKEQSGLCAIFRF
ncbi:MAG: hypothetical protein RL607_984 [Bacteroidota bacterium]|jgi:membrane-associated phospholipid phosphatase